MGVNMSVGMSVGVSMGVCKGLVHVLVAPLNQLMVQWNPLSFSYDVIPQTWDMLSSCDNRGREAGM